MKINQNKAQLAASGLVVMLIIFGISCSKSTKNEAVAEQTTIEEVEPVMVEEIWIIDEHKVNEIPITSHGKKELAEQDGVDAETIDSEAVDEMEEMQEKMEEVKTDELYDIHTMGVIDAMLQEDMAQVEVAEAVIPLEETQTITAYSKKGEEIAELQVVSSGSDEEIDHIIFTDKKHKDVYDVQVGMTGKEVKNLRKELKHMVKKGQVFLYHDESNIMYLMDARDMEGDEIAEADIVNMEVDAIIWKDKKHHKKKS